MKRLFVLRHGKGGAIVRGEGNEPLYFESKPAAKAARDERSGTVVSYGPDHDKHKHGDK
jgi:hypothetical protein